MKNKCTLEQSDVATFLALNHKNDRNDAVKFLFRMLTSFIITKLKGRGFVFTSQYYNMTDLRLAISPEQGCFAYQTARIISAKRIVEFGTSFGISTVYLASAIKDNGGGIVIGSEFVNEKVNIARENLTKLKLLKYTDIRAGDARETLSDPGGSVDMVLLDGSKDLYLDIIRTLKPYLCQGAVVLADNVTSPFIKRTLSSYVRYMQDRKNGFISMTLPFKDGLEFSIKV